LKASARTGLSGKRELAEMDLRDETSLRNDNARARRESARRAFRARLWG
jgi:hypothetical protein